MEIQTNHNVGNTVWLINHADQRLKEYEIFRILIDYKKVNDGIEDYWDAHVEYHVTDGTENPIIILKENEEGKKWWRTRDRAIAYITGKLITDAFPLKLPAQPSKNANVCGLHPIKKTPIFPATGKCGDDSNEDNEANIHPPSCDCHNPKPKKSNLKEAFEDFFVEPNELDENGGRAIRRAKHAARVRKVSRPSSEPNEQLHRVANDMFGNDFG